MERLFDFAGHHPLLAAAVGAAALLVLLYELWLHRLGERAISPQELIRLMNQGALVLDVRSAEQFAAGHINGARQFAQDQLARAGEMLKKYREKPVVVYTDGDARGPAVVRKLAAQGFTRAFCLRGGIDSWRAENLPLARG